MTDQAQMEAQLAAASVSASSPAPRPKRISISMSPEMGQKPKVAMSFPTDLVGTYSCHGVEPGRVEGQAKSKINQDRGVVATPIAEPEDGSYKQALFCVYDGHGAVGDKASQFTADRVIANLEPLLMDGMKEEEALKTAFLQTDDQLKRERAIDAELSGTTAVVVLYRQTGQKHEAWVAWCGDSRCVLAKPTGGGKYEAQDLSHDQKPDTPAEMARIKKAGGFVSPPEEEWGGPARVWIDAEMTLPGLAMARSIGDHLVKAVGVSAEPEVIKYDLSPHMGGFIVLASDGVWEFIESQAECDLVGRFIDGSALNAVTKLIETAAAKWRQEEGDYHDDITAICIKLTPDLFASRADPSTAGAP